jgi:hypothetical protein
MYESKENATLANKAARDYLSKITDKDPSTDQIKHNLAEMKKAADELVVGEKRFPVGVHRKKTSRETHIDLLKKKKEHGKKGGYIVISNPEITSR